MLTANRYLVLGTADGHGQPWATLVFFATLDPTRVCWVSAQDCRHSRNIAHRTAVAITVFDSTIEVGRGEAAYFDAAPATPDETDAALQALNGRLPLHSSADLQPRDQWSSTGPTCATGISSYAAATPSSATRST